MNRARILVLALLVAPGPVLVVAGRGSAAGQLGNYNGTVSATAVHVQAGSAAFPNFSSGAVDNRYPLAAAHVDSSPNAQAFSSALDTGPVGQTAAASGQQNQAQYSDVRCPPQCDDKPVVVGSAPGPFASSQAGDGKAVAEARAAGGAPSGGPPAAPAPPGGGKDSAASPGGGFGLAAPSGAAGSAGAGSTDAAAPPSATPTPGAVLPAVDAARRAALRSALLAWRQRFLTADDARRYPMPAADTPDGVAGDTARSEARLDGSTLILDGTSSVGEIVLGGGALTLRGVNVKVSLTNDGTPKKTVTVNVGAALVGGTPVTIGSDGVSVNGQAVPGIAEAGAQASTALNEALAKAGLEVRSLGPSEQLSDHQLTLDAVGVLVRLAPASPAPGVPAGFVAMAIGEVFADSLAVPGEAGSGELDDGLPDIGDTTGVTPPALEPATTGDAAAAYGSGDASGGADTGVTDGAAGSAFTGSSGRTGSGGSLGGLTGSGASGAALGSTGASSAGPASTGLAAPAASRRLVGHDKPVKLLLLYLLWQSLVIGTVASLYLWRKAAA